jgi:hypothetical protein
MSENRDRQELLLYCNQCPCLDYSAYFFLLDLGANIGVFTIAAVHAGETIFKLYGSVPTIKYLQLYRLLQMHYMDFI